MKRWHVGDEVRLLSPRRGSMGCYVYPLNEVSAGTKAERMTPTLTFLSGAFAKDSGALALRRKARGMGRGVG